MSAVPHPAPADAELPPQSGGMAPAEKKRSFHPLLARATDPDDPKALTFAAAIDIARSSSRLAGRPAFGLQPDDFAVLLDRYFPGAAPHYLPAVVRTSKARVEMDEFDDLVRLLAEHSVDQSDDTRWLAYAISACCMGDDHLWQDMGLADRKSLSDLLERWFPSLFSRNTGGMRWKKFLYKQLCERDGAFVCRSPSCAVCVEYSNCFGPEEDGTWQTPKL